MDEEELIERAEVFAKAHGCTISERLGFGIHGIVIVLKSETNAAATDGRRIFGATRRRAFL